jgi:hypothetical protein
MVTKLIRLTHKIAIQLHLVAESCNICSSRSRRPVRKLLGTPYDLPLLLVHLSMRWIFNELQGEGTSDSL